MSEREYSTHFGLSRGAIQKARKASRLVFYSDGSINAAVSDVRRADITDPDQLRRSTGGDLRRALSLMINRAALVQDGYGDATTASTTMFPD